jgi:hypothetical protein
VVLLDFVDNNGWDRELIGRSFRSSCDKSLSFLDIFQGLIIPRQGIFFGFGPVWHKIPNKNAGPIRPIRPIRPICPIRLIRLIRLIRPEGAT